MQSTLTFGEADPHDVFVDDPEVVLAAHAERKRAAKASADLTSADSAAAEPAQDVMGALLAPQIHVLSDVAAKAPVPPVEPMLRTTSADTVQVSGFQASGLQASDLKASDIRAPDIR